MVNYAHLCTFIGWNRQGGRIYADVDVPYWFGHERIPLTGEAREKELQRHRDLLVTEGGMLDDGSGWEGNRIPFTNDRPDVKFWQAMRDRDRAAKGE